MRELTTTDEAPVADPAPVPRLVLAAGALAMVVAAVGLLDAVFTDEHDFVVLFAALALLGSVQVATALWAPAPVGLRRDVARWLRERSRLTGEPLGHIADRAVSTYRLALGEDDVLRERDER
jgi:hypothetical protein